MIIRQSRLQNKVLACIFHWAINYCAEDMHGADFFFLEGMEHF